MRTLSDKKLLEEHWYKSTAGLLKVVGRHIKPKIK